MDTRTGEIISLKEVLEKDKKEFTTANLEDFFAQNDYIEPILRPLTSEEEETKKIGRNSPCGCGSGKKFKKCCWTGRKV